MLKMAPAPPEVELPIRRIDRRLGELDDRSLIIALYQLGLGWSSDEQLQDAVRAG